MAMNFPIKWSRFRSNPATPAPRSDSTSQESYVDRLAMCLIARVLDDVQLPGLSDSIETLFLPQWALRDYRCLLLMDCSTSMDGTKFQQAKAGGLEFTEQALEKGYQVGIIRFASDADLVCSCTTDIYQIRERIDTLRISGSTNMTAAIHLARTHLATGPTMRAIVLVTDAMPDNPRSTVLAARQARDAGIQIITVGTDNADLAFLEAIATAKDLAVAVVQKQLAEGIVAAARLLPGQSTQ